MVAVRRSRPRGRRDVSIRLHQVILQVETCLEVDHQHGHGTEGETSQGDSGAGRTVGAGRGRSRGTAGGRARRARRARVRARDLSGAGGSEDMRAIGVAR